MEGTCTNLSYCIIIPHSSFLFNHHHCSYYFDSLQSVVIVFSLVSLGDQSSIIYSFEVALLISPGLTSGLSCKLFGRMCNNIENEPHILYPAPSIYFHPVPLRAAACCWLTFKILSQIMGNPNFIFAFLMQCLLV